VQRCETVLCRIFCLSGGNVHESRRGSLLCGLLFCPVQLSHSIERRSSDGSKRVSEGSEHQVPVKIDYSADPFGNRHALEHIREEIKHHGHAPDAKADADPDHIDFRSVKSLLEGQLRFGPGAPPPRRSVKREEPSPEPAQAAPSSSETPRRIHTGSPPPPPPLPARLVTPASSAAPAESPAPEASAASEAARQDSGAEPSSLGRRGLSEATTAPVPVPEASFATQAMSEGTTMAVPAPEASPVTASPASPTSLSPLRRARPLAEGSERVHALAPSVAPRDTEAPPQLAAAQGTPTDDICSLRELSSEMSGLADVMEGEVATFDAAKASLEMSLGRIFGALS